MSNQCNTYDTESTIEDKEEIEMQLREMNAQDIITPQV